MSTAIALIKDGELFVRAFDSDLFNQASLLVKWAVKHGKADSGHCYTFDKSAFRVVDWYEV